MTDVLNGSYIVIIEYKRSPHACKLGYEKLGIKLENPLRNLKKEMWEDLKMIFPFCPAKEGEMAFC